MLDPPLGVACGYDNSNFLLNPWSVVPQRTKDKVVALWTIVEVTLTCSALYFSAYRSEFVIGWLTCEKFSDRLANMCQHLMEGVRAVCVYLEQATRCSL